MNHVLVLDEPTSTVDGPAEALSLEALDKLTPRTTYHRLVQSAGGTRDASVEGMMGVGILTEDSGPTTAGAAS